ncbi:MAG: FAD-binding protein, partial [Coriobacteriales bacterium]|nr:FAD-binding protein [Coriobacteriales bacterium]
MKKKRGEELVRKERDTEQREEGLSRRGFIATAGVSGLVAAASLAGCSPATPANSAPPASGSAQDAASADQGATYSIASADFMQIEEIGEPAETIQADICIIGGGGTGIAAGLQAKELGLEPLILEKQGVYGGSFIGTEGMYAVESHWQKAEGVNTTVSQAIDVVMQYHHYIPNRKIYRNFFGQTADTIQWLEDHGCAFNALVAYNGNRAWHTYASKGDSSPGVSFTEEMAAAAEAADIQVRFNTAGRKILRSSSGAVEGVLATAEDGSVIKVETRAVIIGTGGYSNNMDMLYGLCTSLRNQNISPLGMDCRDGDGIKAAVECGGALAESPGTVMWCGPVAVGASWASDAYIASVQPTLWVNQDAERYTREDLWIGNFAAGGILTRNQQKSFVIFTEADIEHFEQTGPYGTVFTFGIPGTPMPDIRSEFDRLDSVYKADTLAEAAQMAGLDAQALQETVNIYNGYCSSSVDEEFDKAAEYLIPVGDGPYYLVEVADGYYTTVGGIRISPDMEVLSSEFEP